MAGAAAAIDVAAERSLTPGVQGRIHLDSAGASLPASALRRAMDRHAALEERLGGYEAARVAAEEIGDTYRALAGLLGCTRGEIAITESGTKAWSAAFHALRIGPGDRILTTRLEYVSNYLTMLQQAQRREARVELIPQHPDGAFDLEGLRAMIDDRVRLISVAHCGAHNGQVAPAVAIGRLAREAGIPYVLDACQTVGQSPLSVAELGCDVLVGASRKYLRGPRGCGFLFVRRDFAERLTPAAFDLLGAEWTGRDSYRLAPGARRFDSFEGPISARLALGVAVDHARAIGLPAIERRVRRLATRLRTALREARSVLVHDTGPEQGGMVTFEVRGEDPYATQGRLREHGVTVSVIPASMARLDLAPRGLAAVLRASPHYYNTEDEIDQVVAWLRARETAIRR